MAVCEVCEKKIAGTKHYRFGKHAVVCKTCLIKLAEKEDQCPACGTEIDKDTNAIGLEFPVVTNETTHTQTMPIMLTLCPVYGCMFFDEFHRNLLRITKTKTG